jgi:hypothetical protein
LDASHGKYVQVLRGRKVTLVGGPENRVQIDFRVGVLLGVEGQKTV